MLAIAAPSFNKPSETFIRDHVRTIAPGETVLICQDGEGADRLGCPVLANVPNWAPPIGLPARIVSALGHRWRTYVHMALGAEDERRTVAFLREHRVRLLLVEYLHTAVLFRRAARRADVALYAYAHGWDVNILGESQHLRRHYKALFRDARGVIGASELMCRKLRGLGAPEDRVLRAPIGVDPTRFSPVRREVGKKSIVSINRLVPQKGVGLTLKAFARITKHHPDAHLEIIGDGPERRELEELVVGLDLAGSVTLHGAKDSEFVRARLQEASVFAQHCITVPNGGIESFGLSLVEAMATGVPVVASRHGAIPENVVEGETGLLVDEGDVSGMAEAMASLLADPARARAMGQAGRRRVLAHFTHEHARDRLRAIMGFPPFTETDQGDTPGVSES